ncbi:PREDICTED: ribosomal L1 domain-containing protein 1-like [Chrysochloris asiatica]|uniref:Ribosomal L1 domain-containing protein 1 n=1 Tax=Chrysochloris asiatica TaxID=185453 RepID=A0A9B0T422_CHRAS|nr:PREDICTED: ribosomal L1 domain-containing protein 1-like [Chrysochloris asiatica]
MEASASAPTSAPASAATPATPAAKDPRLELNKIQVKKAVKALLAHSESRKNANAMLLNENENMFLMVVLWKIPKKELRARLSLPHAIRSDLTEICLFTKDEPDLTPEKTEQFYRNLLNKHKIKTVSQIISLRTLKQEYKPYEAKLRLLGSFDFFLTDARIRRLLPSIIGKHFYLRKKVPACVNLLAKDLSKEINSCIGGTILNISKNGSCSTVRVGHTGMKMQHIVENIIAVTKGLSEKLPEKWQSVKLLYLKTEKSVALPVFSSYVSSLDGKQVLTQAQKKKDAKKKQTEKLQKKKEKKRRKREMQQAAKANSARTQVKKDTAEIQSAGAQKGGETSEKKKKRHRVKTQLKAGDDSGDEIPLLVPIKKTPAKNKSVEMPKGDIVKKSPQKSPAPNTPFRKKRKATSALGTLKGTEPDFQVTGPAETGASATGPQKKPRIREETAKESASALGKKDPRQTPKKPGPKFFATPSKSARKTPQNPKQQPRKPKVPQLP